MKVYQKVLVGTGGVVGLVYFIRSKIVGDQYDPTRRLLVPGKTIVITGANTGIGKATAKELAIRGAKVILGCRDLKKCEKVRDELIDLSFNRQVVCRELDLSSIRSVHAFADDCNKNESHIDVLINNAGVMDSPDTPTEDGFERHLAVNHLGHFLLTNLLLDKLKFSGPSRIINVSCAAHFRGKLNWDDLNNRQKYDPTVAFRQSKLANVLFTRELAKRLQGTDVTCNAVDPGISNTEISRHLAVSESQFSQIILKPLTYMLIKTAAQGAQTSIYCAIDGAVKQINGEYLYDRKVKKPSEDAQNEEDAKRLWLTSVKWTGLTE